MPQSMQQSQQLPWSQQGPNRAQELEASSAAPAAGQQSDDDEPLDELLRVSGAEVLNRIEACILWFLSDLQAGAIPDLQLVIADEAFKSVPTALPGDQLQSCTNACLRNVSQSCSNCTPSALFHVAQAGRSRRRGGGDDDEGGDAAGMRTISFLNRSSFGANLQPSPVLHSAIACLHKVHGTSIRRPQEYRCMHKQAGGAGRRICEGLEDA